MPQEGHFNGQGECHIHTARGGDTGKCQNASGPNGCDYRKNGGVAAFSPSESHHALCVSSAIAYQTDISYTMTECETIDGAYRNTKWCINQTPNLINLPLKATYTPRLNDGLNLPCHNWDHNCLGGYTSEVTKALKRVWNAIKGQKRDQSEKHATPADVQADLQSIADEYKDVLMLRGKRMGGTAKGFAIYDVLPSKYGTDRSKWPHPMKPEDYWWLPFSMARTPIAGARPVATFGGRPRWRQALKQSLQAKGAI